MKMAVITPLSLRMMEVTNIGQVVHPGVWDWNYPNWPFCFRRDDAKEDMRTQPPALAAKSFLDNEHASGGERPPVVIRYEIVTEPAEDPPVQAEDREAAAANGTVDTRMTS